jgi:phenylalanyl-tRNA synthetase alpha subunit
MQLRPRNDGTITTTTQEFHQTQVLSAVKQKNVQSLSGILVLFVLNFKYLQVLCFKIPLLLIIFP